MRMRARMLAGRQSRTRWNLPPEEGAVVDVDKAVSFHITPAVVINN